ncbi:hypothetical protein AaE_012783 [Aphanomyces astaci]|uniref:Uncharacterized protein n=1 Tax=Aphanomyces astaci TaxID=112090 RepID=A0A6A4Z9L6_APHAT|nr:hypothetical protein AaE_012783 [Aphanomyces astaci]
MIIEEVAKFVDTKSVAEPAKRGFRVGFCKKVRKLFLGGAVMENKLLVLNEIPNKHETHINVLGAPTMLSILSDADGGLVALVNRNRLITSVM